MNTMKGFDAAQSRYDAMVPDDFDQPKPSTEHFDEAFNRLVDNDSVMEDFIDECGPDTTTIFQLFHKYGGIPSPNISEEMDVTRDRMVETCETFLADYRDWLEASPRRRLQHMAQDVMYEVIEANKADAAEYAADCARDARMGL